MKIALSPSNNVEYEPDDEPLQPIQFGQSWIPTVDRPALLPRQLATPPSKPEPTSAPQAKPLYRPIKRPPIAYLAICDDGRSDGELIRIRGDRFIIGRSEGDCLIPHDELISARHAEITREFLGGRSRWIVTDLQSTNGLFVRVSTAALSDRAEFLVGSGRYRFEAASSPATSESIPPASSGATRNWGEQQLLMTPPAVVELVPGGIGNRYVLTNAEYWIGSDKQCAINRFSDPYCESRHARIWRDNAGWRIEHKKTLNGVWLRVPQIATEKGCVFQIGEQRFRLAVELSV